MVVTVAIAVVVAVAVVVVVIVVVVVVVAAVIVVAAAASAAALVVTVCIRGRVASGQKPVCAVCHVRRCNRCFGGHSRCRCRRRNRRMLTAAFSIPTQKRTQETRASSESERLE